MQWEWDGNERDLVQKESVPAHLSFPTTATVNHRRKRRANGLTQVLPDLLHGVYLFIRLSVRLLAE